MRKGRKSPLLRRVRKVGVQQRSVQREVGGRGDDEGNQMDDVTPLVTPPWIASPWLLLDVRYFARCPVCGQAYNSQVMTYATTPLPKKCSTQSHGGALGGCAGTVPSSAL